MNELMIKSKTLDSREVAEMVDKQHSHLLRDINTYIRHTLTNPKLDSLEFFAKSTYLDGKGETRPCYQITKKGCEFIANKLTGQKGTIFTAIYINKFHEMEMQLQDSYMIQDPIQRAQAWIREQEDRQVLLSTTHKQQQIIGELKPKADYTDQILQNKGLVTITQIAKDYGMTGTRMNKLLHDLGVQYKQSGQWLLYREHQSCGYTHSQTIDIKRSDGRPDVKMNTKWTQKGRLFLYNLLRKNGVFPTIERIA